MAQKKAESDSRGSRRAFLRTLAAAAAAPAVPALPATLDVAWMPAKAAQQAQTSDSAEVNALTELVRLRYGEYLEERDRPVLQRGLERIVRTAEALRKAKIGNGDAPDCLFHPDGM